MSNLKPVSVEEAEGATRELFVRVENELGAVPNVLRTLAHAPDVLEAYVGMFEALRNCGIDATLRERLALVVSEAQQSAYGLAHHSATALAMGLSHEEIVDSRRGLSPDRRVEALLQFARAAVEDNCQCSPARIECLRRAGFSERDIAEIIGTIVFTMMTNNFNRLAGTELDFPRVPDLASW